MTDERSFPEPGNAMEAYLAVRKAGREATTHAGRLAERLAEIELREREARDLLERSGVLRRRLRPSGDDGSGGGFEGAN